MDNTIICTAFPKSGVTWLVHLLSDLLDSPQDGPEMTEKTFWGISGNGDYIIRKTHLTADQKPALGKVVFLQRDPRDIVISAMFYQRHTDLLGAINVLCDNYEDWLGSWLNSRNYTVATKYETLHSNPVPELQRIGGILTGQAIVTKKATDAWHRQSFNNMLVQMKGDRHFMRKGIVGDWRNHFTSEAAKLITGRLGNFMMREGYIDNLDWWQEWTQQNSETD